MLAWECLHTLKKSIVEVYFKYTSCINIYVLVVLLKSKLLDEYKKDMYI